MKLIQKVKLAQLSYKSREEIESVLPTAHHIYVKKTDTEGFAYKRNQYKVCFVFAGTNSLKDLWRDLSAFPFDRYYEGYLHRGFAEMREQIEERVIETFDSLNKDQEIKSIELIGHSLGATTAMIAADILYEYLASEIQRDVVTFGCPNGWTTKARTGFESRHTSVTNYINPGDYVTWFIGIFTSRPGKKVKLKGIPGHMIAKYVSNIFYYGF